MPPTRSPCDMGSGIFFGVQTARYKWRRSKRASSILKRKTALCTTLSEVCQATVFVPFARDLHTYREHAVMLPRNGAVYSRVCGWERGSSCLWDFYSETTVVERRSRGVAAGMASNILSSSSFIDTARRIT